MKILNNKNNNILIANAWPYANGHLHLGHIAALIGGDIIARYHRLRGDSVALVSGSDCYGTPIVIEAEAQDISPDKFSEKYHKEFLKNLIEDLHFSYSLFSKTTDPNHAKVVQDIFWDLYGKGLVYKKTEEALFSPELNRFLPDRFVEGRCPHCNYDGCRGDQCDECGKLVDALELGEPRVNKKILKQNVASNSKLEIRETEHFYLKLSALQNKIDEWLPRVSGGWKQNASKTAEGFLKQGLKDRAITRDTDWGVPIPIEGYENKRIYVWFEAVLGYLSTTIQYTEQNGNPDGWKDWWLSDDARHYYVQGKDNVIFHSIILPAILIGTDRGYHLPDFIFPSEYLALEGKQLSTSRNYAVWIPDLVGKIDLETIRFFLSAHGPQSSDADFRWNEFAQIVNGELIGTFANLVNRICSFAEKNFSNGININKNDERWKNVIQNAQDVFEETGKYIESGDFVKSFRAILKYAEEGNKLAHTSEPWKTIKENEKQAEDDTAILLYVIQTLGILTQPFLPYTSYRLQSFFSGTDLIKSENNNTHNKSKWSAIQPPEKYNISNTETLFERVEDAFINDQISKLNK